MVVPHTISIDLGELPPQPESPAAPAWPGWRQRLRERRYRAPLAVVVAALTLLAVTGSAPLPGPPHAPHFSIVAGTFFWDDQHVYALDQSDQQEPVTLTAYRLVDGSIAWQTTPPGFGTTAWLGTTNGMLLLSSSTTNQDGTLTDQVISRLDPDTGQVWWSQAGSLWQVADDYLLLMRHASDQDQPLAEGLALTVTDAATGLPAWELEFAGWNVAIDSAGAGRLLTLDLAGHLTSYELGSGRRLASVAVNDSADQSAATDLVLHPASSTALIRQAGPGGYALHSYDTTTLERLWTIDESGPGFRDGAGPWPHPCGHMICLDGGSPRAIDPLTGRQLWVADWLDALGGGSFGYYGLGLQDLAALGGNVLVTVNSDPPTSWLIDADTGAPVLDLAGWSVWPDEYRAPGDAVSVILGTSIDVDLTPANGQAPSTWIGMIRPDYTGIQPIGSIDGRFGGCLPLRSGYVICQLDRLDPDDQPRVTVWRLR